jgi:hypothetical protein
VSHSRGLQQQRAIQRTEHLGAMAGRLRRDTQALARRKLDRSLNIIGFDRFDDHRWALVD